MRTRARVVAAFASAAAVAALLLTAGTASARDGSGRSEAHGKTAIASFNWHVSRDGSGHAKGYFEGVATQPGGALVDLKGPATCVEIAGNKVGFLYPVEDNSRPFILKGQYVLITGEDNGGKGRDKMGFVGPAPKEFFPNCSPSFAPLSVSEGHISVDH